MAKQPLEENIKNLSADYIYQQAVGSLLLLLISVMEEEEKGVTAIPYDIPSDVAAIRKEIRTYLLNTEDILNGGEETRLPALEKCVLLKKDLLTIYETVYGYFSQWNIVSTLVSDQVALRKYQEEGIAGKEVEWSLFFSDCHGFMESADNVLEQKSYMGELLKCIPLSIARDKYFDLIRQSLTVAFAGESKAYAETSLRAFEGFCCPESNPNYNRYFPEIAEWIGAKRLLLPHKMGNEELAAVYEELNELFEKLGELEEYFSCILHDINSLILLFYLSYDFAELTQSDAVHGDLYHAICDFIGGEWTLTEKAAYLDTLNERLEAAVEPVIDKANEIGKKEVALLEKVSTFENFSEDTKKTLWTEEFIRGCFFGSLNDELFRFDLPEDLPPASEKEKDILFGAFLSRTRNSFDTLPVHTRKIAMQALMGALPPVYTVQEVMSLIMDAIDNAMGEEQKILIVNKVGMVFGDHGYQSIADAHAHDHDCGCGHDHDHGHSCDCGHDHH